MHFLYDLPLFLCSIQLIAIPMAAFCKGRVKEACLDFVLTFGILGAVFGVLVLITGGELLDEIAYYF